MALCEYMDSNVCEYMYSVWIIMRCKYETVSQGFTLLELDSKLHPTQAERVRTLPSCRWKSAFPHNNVHTPTADTISITLLTIG